MLGKAQNGKDKAGENMVQKLKCSPQGYNLGTTGNQRRRDVFRHVKKENRAGQKLKRCDRLVGLPTDPS